MASFAAKTLLALAVSATAIVPLNAAHADEWRHRNRDAALVGGVLGLAAGVAVGSALAQPRYSEEPVYVDPPVRRYPAYQPSYVYSEPDDGYYRPAPRPVYRAQPVYDARPLTSHAPHIAPLNLGLKPGSTTARSVMAASMRARAPTWAMMAKTISALRADL